MTPSLADGPVSVHSTSSPRRRWSVVLAAASAVAVLLPLAAAAEAAEPTTTTTPTPTTTTVPNAAVAPSTAATTTTTTTTPVVVTTTSVAAAPTSTVPTAVTTTAPADPESSTAPAPATVAPNTTVLPPAPPERNVQVFPEQIEHILATIRYQESRGNYTIGPNKGNASGAYQFIESTWNGYGGYQHAYLAPPSVQDERAALDVRRFLDQFDDDVSMVPVMWYYPIAARQPELMDRIPKPEHGNVLTIREYQTRWLAVFASISGQPVAPRVDPAAPIDVTAIVGTAPELPRRTLSSAPPTVSYPVLGPSRVAAPDCSAADPDTDTDDTSDGEATGPTRADIHAAGLCTPQAPAVIFGVKLQPVLAVADGIVTAVSDRPGSGEPISVTITDWSGLSFVHAGFNDDNPGTDDGAAPAHLRLTSLSRVGTMVRAGQIIGFMGNTAPLPVDVRVDVPTDASVTVDLDAVAPHIRITMFSLDGSPVDAFAPVVDSLFRQTCRVMIGPWSMPANGSGHDPVVVETTDDDDSIDSQWTITSSGQVQASGWAAMVNPSEGCPSVPDDTRGADTPDTDASDVLHWSEPADLSTRVWVSLTRQEESVTPVMFVG